jgi:hypothetical protein
MSSGQFIKLGWKFEAKTPFIPCTGEFASFNPLFERIFDYNRDTRATITEVQEIINKMID